MSKKLKILFLFFHVAIMMLECKDEVYNVLEGSVHEIARNISLGPALEVDLIFRVGNQIGIAEVKTGRTAQSKVGIDQLNTAAGREYLGTYIKKFLIINCAYPENNSLLAQERNIHVVELTGNGDNAIAPEDQEKLKKAVLQQM